METMPNVMELVLRDQWINHQKQLQVNPNHYFVCASVVAICYLPYSNPQPRLIPFDLVR